MKRSRNKGVHRYGVPVEDVRLLRISGHLARDLAFPWKAASAYKREPVLQGEIGRIVRFSVSNA